MKFYRKHKKTSIFLLVILLLFVALLISSRSLEGDAYFSPVDEQSDLTYLADKELLKEEDYQLIFRQTGLGKPAVEKIFAESAEPVVQLITYQNDFYRQPIIKCKGLNVDMQASYWVTGEEHLYNEKGEVISGFKIADLQDGDILLTKSTHTLFWRHGHGGLITDSKNGFVMEAPMIGYSAALYRVRHWQTYPTFIQLRLNNADAEQRSEIAAWAKDYLMGLIWQPYAGFPDKYNEKNLSSTQCSLFIWQAFYHFGYDCDIGGWLVAPQDLANSPLFEVVQIFGVNPADIWSGFNLGGL